MYVKKCLATTYNVVLEGIQHINNCLIFTSEYNFVRKKMDIKYK